MKVIVDLDVCEAHGDCVVAAPEIFDLGDDDDVVTVLQPEPPEELRQKAEKAASDCPVAAITIQD
jgi:ferredoxin